MIFLKKVKKRFHSKLLFAICFFIGINLIFTGCKYEKEISPNTGGNSSKPSATPCAESTPAISDLKTPPPGSWSDVKLLPKYENSQVTQNIHMTDLLSGDTTWYSPLFIAWDAAGEDSYNMLFLQDMKEKITLSDGTEKNCMRMLKIRLDKKDITAFLNGDECCAEYIYGSYYYAEESAYIKQSLIVLTQTYSISSGKIEQGKNYNVLFGWYNITAGEDKKAEYYALSDSDNASAQKDINSIVSFWETRYKFIQ